MYAKQLAHAEYVLVDGQYFQTPPLPAGTAAAPAAEASAKLDSAALLGTLQATTAAVPRVPNCSAAALDPLEAAALALLATFAEAPVAVQNAHSAARSALAQGALTITTCDAAFCAASGLTKHSELCREWAAVANLAGTRPSGVHLPLLGQPFLGQPLLGTQSAAGGAFAGGAYAGGAGQQRGGVLYYLGTACGAKQYKNPHTRGAVVASMSSEGGSSKPHKLVDNPPSGSGFSAFGGGGGGGGGNPADNYTEDRPGSWMAVDLGEGVTLYPEEYCLKTTSHTDYKLRSWHLQVVSRALRHLQMASD